MSESTLLISILTEVFAAVNGRIMEVGGGGGGGQDIGRDKLVARKFYREKMA